MEGLLLAGGDVRLGALRRPRRDGHPRGCHGSTELWPDAIYEYGIGTHGGGGDTGDSPPTSGYAISGSTPSIDSSPRSMAVFVTLPAASQGGAHLWVTPQPPNTCGTVFRRAVVAGASVSWP